MRAAIAGEAVKPGDCMPAAMMKPGTLVSPIMKSSSVAGGRRPTATGCRFTATGRMPTKDVITSVLRMAGTIL